MKSYFNNIDSAYEYGVGLIKKYGFKRIDERGDEVLQLPFLHLKFKHHIKQIGTVKYVPEPTSTLLNKSMLNDYKEQLLIGTDKDFIYTYQDRFCNHFSINQYEYIVDKLKRNKESRRAVAITWNPNIDPVNDEVPCLNYLCCSVYDNELFMNVVFRSNDFTTAFVANMYGLMNLQLYLADKIGVNVGDFNYCGNNVHLIKNNE